MHGFCHRCYIQTHTNDLFSFEFGQVSHFAILSLGLSLSTITNALTRALQSVIKRKKNIQCCHLAFFQFNQHEFYSSNSKRFHYFIHPLYTGQEVVWLPLLPEGLGVSAQ
jgi:hypothetical protein